MKGGACCVRIEGVGWGSPASGRGCPGCHTNRIHAHRVPRSVVAGAVRCRLSKVLEQPGIASRLDPLRGLARGAGPAPRRSAPVGRTAGCLAGVSRSCGAIPIRHRFAWLRLGSRHARCPLQALLRTGGGADPRGGSRAMLPDPLSRPSRGGTSQARAFASHRWRPGGLERLPSLLRLVVGAQFSAQRRNASRARQSRVKMDAEASTADRGRLRIDCV